MERPVLLKREDMHPVFSFKIRGAANKMLRLTEAQKKAGVITASAGNHAQGVALAANKLGIKAVIVMPSTTPDIKIEAVRTRGAEVILHGDAFPESLQHALDLQTKTGMSFVHPYDDDDVIAGQGTIAREMLEQYPEPIEAVFVPVGGGGLAAGVVAWIKYLRPDIKVYGVEPSGSDCLHQALTAGRRVKLPQVELFADGVAVAQIGEKPFDLLREGLDGTIVVGVDEICAAAWDIFAETRTMPEPAGALGLAGLKKYAEANPADNQGALMTIVSGANVDSERMRYMTERVVIGQKRELLMAVALPERPGALLEFCAALGNHGLTEFNYRYADAKRAQIFVGVRVQNHHRDGAALFAKLTAGGFSAADMTNNDLAKEHIRHMVGGRPPCPLNEALYSFEFPERPGALFGFLKKMPPTWNISLFHYRSHGASHGRVLIGLQVPASERAQLHQLLSGGEFNGREETDNFAYSLFLSDGTEKAAAL